MEFSKPFMMMILNATFGVTIWRICRPLPLSTRSFPNKGCHLIGRIFICTFIFFICTPMLVSLAGPSSHGEALELRDVQYLPLLGGLSVVFRSGRAGVVLISGHDFDSMVWKFCWTVLPSFLCSLGEASILLLPIIFYSFFLEVSLS